MPVNGLRKYLYKIEFAKFLSLLNMWMGVALDIPLFLKALNSFNIGMCVHMCVYQLCNFTYYLITPLIGGLDG